MPSVSRTIFRNYRSETWVKRLFTNGAAYRDRNVAICLILPVRIRIRTEMLARTLLFGGVRS